MGRVKAARILDNFIKKWVEQRSGATAIGEDCKLDIEEFGVFLEKFCKCLDENDQIRLNSATLQSMNIPTRIKYLVSAVTAIMIVNIDGDRKEFLCDFMENVERLFAKTAKQFLPHPPSSTLLH